MTAVPPPSSGRELSNPPADGVSNLRFSNHSDHLLVSSWDKVRPHLSSPVTCSLSLSNPSFSLLRPFDCTTPVPMCCAESSRTAVPSSIAVSTMTHPASAPAPITPSAGNRKPLIFCLFARKLPQIAYFLNLVLCV